MVYDGSIYEWSRKPHLELVTGMDDFVIKAASVDNGCG